MSRCIVRLSLRHTACLLLCLVVVPCLCIAQGNLKRHWSFNATTTPIMNVMGMCGGSRMVFVTESASTLFDTETNQTMRTLPSGEAMVSPDDRTLLIRNGMWLVCIDCITGTTTDSLALPMPIVYGFSRDGSIAVVVVSEGYFMLYDMKNHVVRYSSQGSGLKFVTSIVEGDAVYCERINDAVIIPFDDPANPIVLVGPRRYIIGHQAGSPPGVLHSYDTMWIVSGNQLVAHPQRALLKTLRYTKGMYYRVWQKRVNGGDSDSLIVYMPDLTTHRSFVIGSTSNSNITPLFSVAMIDSMTIVFVCGDDRYTCSMVDGSVTTRKTHRILLSTDNYSGTYPNFNTFMCVCSQGVLYDVAKDKLYRPLPQNVDRRQTLHSNRYGGIFLDPYVERSVIEIDASSVQPGDTLPYRLTPWDWQIGSYLDSKSYSSSLRSFAGSDSAGNLFTHKLLDTSRTYIHDAYTTHRAASYMALDGQSYITLQNDAIVAQYSLDGTLLHTYHQQPNFSALFESDRKLIDPVLIAGDTLAAMMNGYDYYQRGYVRPRLQYLTHDTADRNRYVELDSVEINMHHYDQSSRTHFVVVTKGSQDYLYAIRPGIPITGIPVKEIRLDHEVKRLVAHPDGNVVGFISNHGVGYLNLETGTSRMIGMPAIDDQTDITWDAHGENLIVGASDLDSTSKKRRSSIYRIGLEDGNISLVYQCAGGAAAFYGDHVNAAVLYIDSTHRGYRINVNHTTGTEISRIELDPIMGTTFEYPEHNKISMTTRMEVSTIDAPAILTYGVSVSGAPVMYLYDIVAEHRTIRRYHLPNILMSYRLVSGHLLYYAAGTNTYVLDMRTMRLTDIIPGIVARSLESASNVVIALVSDSLYEVVHLDSPIGAASDGVVIHIPTDVSQVPGRYKDHLPKDSSCIAWQDGVLVRTSYSTGVRTILQHQQYDITCATSPNDLMLAVISDTSLIVYDTRDWTILGTYAFTGGIQRLEWTDDNESILITHGGNTVGVYTIPEAIGIISDIDTERNQNIITTNASFSAQYHDGVLIISHCFDNPFMVRVYSVNGEELTNGTFDGSAAKPGHAYLRMNCSIQPAVVTVQYGDRTTSSMMILGGR